MPCRCRLIFLAGRYSLISLIEEEDKEEEIGKGKGKGKEEKLMISLKIFYKCFFVFYFTNKIITNIVLNSDGSIFII